jgi:hypothetical protein
MVRYLLSLNWDGFFRSTVLTAFEAYGSALVGITPTELPGDSRTVPASNLPVAHRG